MIRASLIAFESMTTTAIVMYRRLCTIFVALTFACACSGEARADGGPSQPEAVQFEPVDVSDVVNLATGDFTYSLPLMTVPGPSGGYPLVLSYHAGIGPNQDATWVGLGWTLNPGAINRVMSGYPDDYKSRSVLSRYYDRDSGYGVSLSMGWGPVGLNMTYDSHSGFGGVNAMVGMAIKGTGLNVQLSTSGTVSVGLGGAGVGPGLSRIAPSLSVSVGPSGIGYNGNLSVTRLDGLPGSDYEVGASFSMSSGGASASFLPAGVGISSTSSSAGRGSVSSSGFSIPIPLPGGFRASLGYSEWEWELNALVDQRAHGYMYAARIGSVDQDPNSYAKQEVSQEHHISDGVVYPTPDLFQVSAQGISGQFMTLPKAGQELASVTYGDNGQASYVQNSGVVNRGATYRFLGEQAGGYITPSDGLGFDSEYQSASAIFTGDDALDGFHCSAGSYQCTAGRTVEPLMDADPSVDVEGLIEGFKVYDIDGKVYEFAMPVYNRFQYTWSCEGKDCSSEEEYLPNDLSRRNSTAMGTPYSTSWLLTSVVGPDYIDREPEGKGPEDWGYWVSFGYNKSSEMMMWRSPVHGFVKSGVDIEGDYGRYPDEDKVNESMSFGLRDYVYLTEVETATHKAVMNVGPVGGILSSTDRGPMIERSGYFGGTKSKFDDVEYSEVYQILNQELIDSDSNGTYDQHRISINNNIIMKTILENNIYGTIFELTYYDDGWKKRSVGALDIVSFKFGGNNEDKIDIVFEVPFSPSYYDDIKLSISQTLIDEWLSPEVVKLKGIDLFRRVGDSETFDGEPIRSVVLSSSLNLAPGKPGSNSGKLTLNRVEFLGKNRGQYMPPYEFRYGGENFRWEIDKWDSWGGYRSNELILPSPEEQYRKASEDASAWSMTSITTPTGARVDVEYESDDYYAVNELWPVNRGIEINIDNAVTGGSSGTFVFDASQYEHKDLGVGEYIYISDWCYFGLFNRNIISREYIIQSIYIEDGDDAQGQITINGVHTFKNFDDCSDEVHSIVLPPARTYGGGHRVKSISTTVGDDIYHTEYSYDVGSRSSGATASLSNNEIAGSRVFHFPNYSVDWYTQRRYRDSFLGSRHGFSRPAPAVLYGRVETKNYLNGDQQGGRTVQEFYTAEDFPYIVVDSHPNQNNPPGDGEMREVEVLDYSSIYGRPKRTILEEGEGNRDYGYATLEEIENIYAFDYNIAENALLLRSVANSASSLRYQTASPGRSLMMGGTYIRHRFRTSCESDDSFNECKIGRIIRKYHNVYGLGNRSSKIYSGGDAANFVTSSRQVAFDILSGRPVASLSSSGDQSVTINLTRPAHHFYNVGNRTMWHKNMLTQGGETIVFKTGQSNVVSSCKDATSPACGGAAVSYLKREDLLSHTNSDVISAEAVTWSNSFGEEAEDLFNWRILKNDTYVFDRQYDFSSFWLNRPGSPFGSDYMGDEYLESSIAFPWRMTSNIVSYDKAANVIESVAEDGSYSSSQYDDTGSLVLAVASNARLDEFVYQGFESYEDGDEIISECAFCRVAGDRATRTGEVAVHSSQVSVQIPVSLGRSFTVEVWVSPADAARVELRVSGQVEAVTEGEGWQLLRARGQLAGGTVSLSGSGYADDVRVYPDDARVSTFVYDPVTWELTSITDAANRTTYFEYDVAGRLVRTRDDTGNLITANRYAYAKNDDDPSVPLATGDADQLVILGPFIADELEEVTYETLYLGSGSPTYTWYVREWMPSQGEDIWVEKGSGNTFTTMVEDDDYDERYHVRCVSSLGDEAEFVTRAEY